MTHFNVDLDPLDPRFLCVYDASHVLDHAYYTATFEHRLLPKEISEQILPKPFKDLDLVSAKSRTRPEVGPESMAGKLADALRLIEARNLKRDRVFDHRRLQLTLELKDIGSRKILIFHRIDLR